MVKLPRAPGEREARWAHLLCGEVALPPAVQAGSAHHADAGAVSAGELASLKAEQTRLAAQVDELQAQVQRLNRELGLEHGVSTTCDSMSPPTRS